MKSKVQSPKSKVGAQREPETHAEGNFATLTLPVGDFHPERHKPLHIEARLTDHQGRALQRLLNGLNEEYGAGWAPRERSFADVLRWLLDQLPG